MKKLLTFILALISMISIGQKIDSVKFYKLLTEKLAPNDLSNLFKSDPNIVVGFIGTNYQRFQIYFDTVMKDKKDPNEYHVKGKSMVKGNICEFNGVIIITETVESENYEEVQLNDSTTRPTLENLDYAREGGLSGHYVFKEDSTQKYSGIFEGEVDLNFEVDNKYHVSYDNSMSGADDYSNNQYTGTWTSYDKKIKKVCNWGDYRIPASGDLDIGVGDFSPNEKYKMNGWADYCNSCPDDSLKKQKNWWEGK